LHRLLRMNDCPDPANPIDQDDPAARESDHHLRPIKSYVLRAGRMGPGQLRAFDLYGPRFLLPFERAPLDARAAFGKDAPLIFEIGFGMGDATAHIARHRPDDNFLCCEVHAPGVGALLKRCGQEEIVNIRIVQHDAVEVLDHMIAPGSLDGAHLFFPDPWHKARHHKRRLVQPPFIAKLVTRLKPGGYLHCATDWQPYAEQMLQVLSGELQLVNTAADYAPKPDYRPLTKFEHRGLKLGHGVWDLVFQRR
jgi:tRNA (guanine-N7-)-methyltransferase